MTPRPAPVQTYVHEHRVRYRECDPMGVVYHTHYLDHFEAARTEALRAAGLAYKALEDAGVLLVVIDAALHYHRPARYDDVLEIEASFHDPVGLRLPVDYAVRRKAEAPVLVSGRVVLCSVDRATRRPIALPGAVREALARGVAGAP